MWERRQLGNAEQFLAVGRLLLYWMAEEEQEKALMAFPYHPERIYEAGRYFDEVVQRIQAEEWRVTQPPEAAICKECDLRLLCHAEGIISTEEGR